MYLYGPDSVVSPQVPYAAVKHMPESGESEQIAIGHTEVRGSIQVELVTQVADGVSLTDGLAALLDSESDRFDAIRGEIEKNSGRVNGSTTYLNVDRVESIFQTDIEDLRHAKEDEREIVSVFALHFRSPG